MKKNIQVEIAKHFQAGFHCAEAMAMGILESFGREVPPEVIKAASGFGGGIAGSGEELCGAFTGGVIALGLLLGRETPGLDLRECALQTLAFKEKFADRFGALTCGTLTEKLVSAQNPLACVKLTAEAGAIIIDLLEGTDRLTGLDHASNLGRPLQKVEPGHCPFSGRACA